MGLICHRWGIPLFCLIMCCSSLISFYFSLAQSEVLKHSRQGWNHRTEGNLELYTVHHCVAKGRSKGLSTVLAPGSCPGHCHCLRALL